MASNGDLHHAVELALNEAGAGPVSWGDAGWRLSLSNGSEIGTRARIADDWLELTATPLRAAPAEFWRTRALLQLNASLASSVRVAVGGPGGVEHLRADVCLAELDDPPERLTRVCDDLRSATHVLHGDGQVMLAPSRDEDRELGAERFASLCVEAGWAPATKVSGEVALELTTDCGVFEAQLDSSAGSGIRLLVRLFDIRAYSNVCFEAAGLFLLVASARVRSIKGVIAAGNQAEFFGVAAASEVPRSPGALSRSLQALTVACRLVGREMQALQNETLAREYLALWGRVYETKP